MIYTTIWVKLNIMNCESSHSLMMIYLWFYLYEMARIGKSTKIENILFPRAMRFEENGCWWYRNYLFFFVVWAFFFLIVFFNFTILYWFCHVSTWNYLWRDKSVSKLNGGNGCTTLWINHWNKWNVWLVIYISISWSFKDTSGCTET